MSARPAPGRIPTPRTHGGCSRSRRRRRRCAVVRLRRLAVRRRPANRPPVGRAGEPRAAAREAHVEVAAGEAHDVTSPSPCVAAATATALVPDAAVSPTPRSQTRAVTTPGPSTRDDLHVRALREARMRLEQRPELRRSVGVADDDRVRVARPRRGRDARSRRRAPARRPRPRRGPARRARPPCIRAAHGLAAPTRTVDRARRRCAPRASAAAIRVPLPDISAVEPSGFKIPIVAVVAAVRAPRGCRRCPRRRRRRAGVSQCPQRRGRRSRARASATISSAISPGGRSAATITTPGIRRSHFRW